VNTRSCTRFLFLAILAITLPCRAFSGGVKGHLVIIGDGGDRSEQFIQRYVELAGGAERARIIILPMASSIPDTVGMRQVEMLKSLGVRHAEFLLFTREQAMMKGFADTLNRATGIFFTGGDQSRLAAVVVGTPVQEKLIELYRKGIVIGGGSAGAAIMSKVMITGDERLNTDSTNAFISIQRGNIVTAEGLGFLDDAIIDQHFVKRKRHNRLISVVLEHPQLVGIGIDERTAIIVNPDHTFEVVGKSCVVVYDARKAQGVRSGPNNAIGGTHLTMHVLLDGDRYNITTGHVRSSGSKK
jgi:cyanophycinase